MNIIDSELKKRSSEFKNYRRTIIENSIGSISTRSNDETNSLSITRAQQTQIQSLLNKLDKIKIVLNEGKLDIKKCIEDYNTIIPICKWPSVLLYSDNIKGFYELCEQISSSGFPAKIETNQKRGNGSNINNLFRFIHIHIPPDEDFLSHITYTMNVTKIFDGDAIYNLPEPDKKVVVDYPDNYNKDIIAHPGLKFKVQGEMVKICIVDTGIDTTHPDIFNRVILSEDFTNDNNIDDLNGHGTHCAGIAAGSGISSSGRYSGIAPKAQLLSAKVLDHSGSGSISWILNGMTWAFENGADIINLSLGAAGVTNGRSILSTACDELVKRGLIVCIAAGNGGPGQSTIGTPGDAKLAETVGAIDHESKLAEFSSRGPTDDPEHTGIKPNVVAPGVRIVSLRAKNGKFQPYPDHKSYCVLSGTSMATPHLAGAAALALSWARDNKLDFPPKKFREILHLTSRKLEGYKRDDVGDGLMQITELLDMITPLNFNGRDRKEQYCDIDGRLVSNSMKFYLCEECKGKIICESCYEKGVLKCSRCRNKTSVKPIKSILEEFKEQEKFYHSRIRQNLADIKGLKIANPATGEKAVINTWDSMPVTQIDDLENIKRMIISNRMKTGERINEYPLNLYRIYRINKIKFTGFQFSVGLITGVISNHESILMNQEGLPLKRTYIIKFLKRIDSYLDARIFYFIGLYSPAGWDRDCRDNIPSDANYRMFLISRDEDNHWVVDGPEDGDSHILKELFNPESFSEKLKKLKQYIDIEGKLAVPGDWIRSEEIQRELKYTRNIVIRLFKELIRLNPALEMDKANGNEILCLK